MADMAQPEAAIRFVARASVLHGLHRYRRLALQLSVVTIGLGNIPVQAAAPRAQALEPDVAHVQNDQADLTASFAFDPHRQTWRLAYKIHNRGTTPLMVMDGGYMKAGRREPGQPRQKITGTDLTLSHEVVPLPDPSPTVPLVVLARRVTVGGRADAHYPVYLLGDPSRVRYCLGVAPWDKSQFLAVDDDDTRWRTSVALAESQALLCTPWYDLQAHRFMHDSR